MSPLPLLISAALAAELPSVDEPPSSGVRNWYDAAVVIGVAAYDDFDSVPYAHEDAEAFENWIEKVHAPSSRRMFTIEDPSDAEMRSMISRGIARVRSRGTLWIYYVGQGAAVEGEAVIFGSDMAPDELGGGLTLAELEGMANRSRAARVVIIVDADFTGNSRSETAQVEALENLRLAAGDSSKVSIWVADHGGRAQVYAPAGHGLFTYLALGAMEGWADGADGSEPDGEVTLGVESSSLWTSMVGRWVRPREVVCRLT